MYTVSNLWNKLISSDDHYFETLVMVNGVAYGENVIFSVSTDYRMFNEEQMAVGGCLAAELTVSLLAPSTSIPRMAQVRPYVRVTDGEDASEWIPQGVFYIDTREVTANNDELDILTLHCYDAMLKTEAVYPETSHDWPTTDTAVVREIAATIGVSVDARTWALMTAGYSISVPGTYTMREVLSYIAAMYAGNWVMNYDGGLLLIAVNGIPPETNYLIDEKDNRITIGGDRIVV